MPRHAFQPTDKADTKLCRKCRLIKKILPSQDKMRQAKAVEVYGDGKTWGEWRPCK